MVMTPTRWAPKLDSTENCTLPEPEPENPFVTTNQTLSLEADQAHPGEVVTVIEPPPPDAGTLVPEPGPSV